MADNSAIEWTDATWNPIVGCSIISPGCTNCYAMKMAARIQKMNRTGGSNSDYVNHYDATTVSVNHNVVWSGKVAIAPDKIFLRPLSRKSPTTYFVNSMGDLFHEDVPDEWIDRVFAVMALAPQHTFQVLTKRAARMHQWFAPFDRRRADSLGKNVLALGFSAPLESLQWPLPNVWLGVSAERQQEWDERKEHLRRTPSAVRFASFEPLLGSIVELNPISDYLQWVIVGGESGPNARPMHPDWARELREACTKAAVPFFFKQWGEYLPVGQSLPGFGKIHGATAVKPGRLKLHYGGTPQQHPKYAFAERGVDFESTADGRLTFRVGKKTAGRLLDGVEHNGFPTRRISDGV